MGTWKQALVLLCGMGLLAGCDTFYQGGSSGADERYAAARVEMSRQQAARDFERLKAQADVVNQNLQNLDARLDRMESEARQSGAARAELEALRRDVDQLRADRAQLRKEIVDDLSREMAKLLAAQTVAPSRPSGGGSSGKQAGWEHKVQAGQTLSEIAQAYNSSVSAIQKANNLKDDRIHVGQVLFIPE